MSKEIEFDEGDKPAPEEKEEKLSLEDILAELKKLGDRLAKVEKLQEDEEEEDVKEEAEEAEEETKAEEPEEEKAQLKDAVKQMKKDYEKMSSGYVKLSKKLEKLENTPDRMTSPDVQDDADKRIEQFLSDINAGEALIWAEKRGIKWGDKRGD